MAYGARRPQGDMDAASGVMRYLEQRKIGFDMGRYPRAHRACGHRLRPRCRRRSRRLDAQAGYRACEAAGTQRLAKVTVGAGAAATAGKLFGGKHARCGAESAWPRSGWRGPP